MEAAVHATRQFLESIEADAGIIKLDFQNAFNCLRRDAILEQL
jgi:hypothetical protein